MNFPNESDNPRRDQPPDQAAINVAAFFKVEEKHSGQYADDNEINQCTPDDGAEGIETVVKRKPIGRQDRPQIRHHDNHTHAASSQYCSCLHKLSTRQRQEIPDPGRIIWREQADAVWIYR